MRRKKIITSECWAIIYSTNQMYNISISYNEMTDVNVNNSCYPADTHAESIEFTRSWTIPE